MQDPTDRDLTHLGHVIRNHSISKNISQQELADLCGISLSTLRRAKSGADSINLDTAIKIANVLEISLDELTGRQEYIHEDVSDLMLKIESLEHKLSEQEKTVLSLYSSNDILHHDLRGKDALIESLNDTIRTQRMSIRRGDIFGKVMLSVFLFLVFLMLILLIVYLLK